MDNPCQTDVITGWFLFLDESFVILYIYICLFRRPPRQQTVNPINNLAGTFSLLSVFLGPILSLVYQTFGRDGKITQCQEAVPYHCAFLTTVGGTNRLVNTARLEGKGKASM